MGSGFALCRALRKTGKKANLLCSDEIPSKFRFLSDGIEPLKFSPNAFIAIDVAEPKLLGQNLAQYADYIDLCVDHHISNSLYAKRTLLNSKAAAAGETVYMLLSEMETEFDDKIAEALYTGIVTDTGCFRYPNATSETLAITSELMKFKIDCGSLNRRLFAVKTRGKIALEIYIMSNMEYYLEEKCAICAITSDVTAKTGAGPEDAEDLTSFTTALEGVEVGILIKEREKGGYRVSMRSVSDVDVSAVCRKFGGGGHIRAAGCSLNGKLEDIKLKLLSAVAEEMNVELWLA